MPFESSPSLVPAADVPAADGGAAAFVVRGPEVRARTMILLVCAACSAGCASSSRGGEPAPPLVVQRSAGVVLGHAADVEVTLWNRGDEPLRVPRPGPAFLLVHAQTDRGVTIPCAAPAAVPDRVELVDLPPGGSLPVRLDFTSRCSVDPTTEFIAHVRYSVPPITRERAGAGGAWTGVTEPLRLQVAPSLGAAQTATAAPPLGPPGVDRPEATVPPAPALPAAPGHPMRPPAHDGPHAGEYAQCVDAELARRSLDAWARPSPGSPPGPPPDVQGRDRLELVLERVPEIGVACAAAPLAP
jgi:hypothetical protein